jgi:hypothetical protein
MDPAVAPRTFRLSPPDRTGWMFGLSLIQLVAVALSVAVGAFVLVVASPAAGGVILVAGTTVGAARVHGAALLELAPHGARYLRVRARRQPGWFQPLARLGGDHRRLSSPMLDGQEVVVIDAGVAGSPGREIALVRDRRSGILAVTVRASGRHFALLERSEQDWMCTQWGNALGAFVSERAPVVSIRWAEWAAPAGLDEHRRWVGDHLAAEPVAGAVAAYRDLLAEAGSTTIRHDILVTLCIDPGRLPARSRKPDAGTDPAIAAALRETKLFAQRLQAAGLTVSAPLSPGEWARVMRLRLDPTCRLALDGRLRSQLGGHPRPANAGPLAAWTEWTAWRADGSWHRALYVSDWPRIDVPAGWMSDLLLYAGTVRTVAVVFEPVARSRSQRSIVRDAAKIESDAAHRAEKGFRVGAHHRRAARAVEEREEELVAGYGEFTYAGIVVVTAADLDALDAQTAELTQIAAAAGIETRPLHGRHDLAVVATLPVAAGLHRNRWQ